MLSAAPNPSPPILLAYPFRPFFLLTGIYAAVLIGAWTGYLFWGWPLPLGWSSFKWHSHEMLYGLVPAAVAGFLLTAITNWTGAQPLRGAALLGLVGVWVAGRVALWTASWLPAWLVALLDLSFLAILTLYVTSTLMRYQNRRNYILVAVLLLFTLGNVIMHVGFATGHTAWLEAGQLHGLDVVTLLMVIIGGRIIPSFSANWLRNQGLKAAGIRQSANLDRLALGSVALLLPLDWFAAPGYWWGAVALAAGLTNGVRLIGWCGWRVWREPLLWILHLAYLWIVIALLLRAGTGFAQIPASAWQHALGVGAIATLIIGVMTRVSMGHTGRPLKLPEFGLIIYAFILAAALARVLVALQLLQFTFGIFLAASLWVAAFAIFVGLYAPVLARPRADGRPG